MTLMLIGPGGMELAVLLLMLASLAGFAFWLWMLIDCLTREQDQNQKLVWVILIAVVGIVGAPLYFFMRKLRRGTHRET